MTIPLAPSKRLLDRKRRNPAMEVSESWDESDHPRDDDGKFSGKGGVSRSGEFSAWFGSSKVVDNSGEPLVVYHGTKADFDEFNRTGDRLTALGQGYYFTPDPKKAEQYGDVIMPVYLSSEKLLDWQNLSKQDRDKVVDRLKQIVPQDRLAGFGGTEEKRFPSSQKDEAYKFFRDKQRETAGLYHDRAKAKASRVGDEFVVSWGVPGLDGATDANLLALAQEFDNNIAQSLGYDGARNGSEIVVFDPSQIKSATGNRGTYDRNSKKISEEFSEIDHPRDDRGRFADKHGAGSLTRTPAEIPMPSEVNTLASLIQKGGDSKLYAVGGAVRDYLMHKMHAPDKPYEPHDVDLTTNLSEGDILERLSTPEARAAGVRVATKSSVDTFGVVFVDVNGAKFEIAPFRKDIGSADGRRPDRVERGTMQDDAERRDLTMNNLYYDLETREVIDPNPDGQGVKDIAERTVRMVGDPWERFEEDRLRVLRMVRFFSRFNDGDITHFLDQRTLDAVDDFRTLHGVSNERIANEFASGVQKARDVGAYVNNFQKLDLSPRMFGGMSVDTKTAKRLGETRDLPVVLAAMLHENDQIEKRLVDLKYSRDTGKRAQFLAKAMSVNADNVADLLKTRQSLEQSGEGMQEQIEKQLLTLANVVRDEDVAERLRHFAGYRPPKVSGAAMRDSGMPPAQIGKEISKLITNDYLSSWQSLKPVTNDAEHYAKVSKWASSLTPEEQQAMRSWGRSGYHMRTLQRNGDEVPTSDGDRFEIESAKRNIQHLESALNKGVRYTGTVYRGLEYDSIDKVKELIGGKDLVLHNDQSSSKDKSLAMQHAGNSKFGNTGVLFKIDQMSGVDVGTETGVFYGDDPQTGFVDEKEVVLRKGTQYQVTGWKYFTRDGEELDDKWFRWYFDGTGHGRDNWPPDWDPTKYKFGHFEISIREVDRKASESERWVTLQSGVHVKINSDGEVTVGPKSLTGLDLDGWGGTPSERRARRLAKSADPDEPASDSRKVDVVVKREDAVNQIKSAMNMEIPTEDIAKLTGAMHGSNVSIKPYTGGSLRLENNDDRYRTVSVLHHEDGELVLENQNFQVFDKGMGVGTELLYAQVRQAEKLGVKRIVVDSVGNWEQHENHNGYYTWPRLGFDGELPKDWKDRLAANGLDPEDIPDKLKDATRVSDFFQLKDGRHIWKLYGFGLPLEFDPAQGSRSRQVLDSYAGSEKRAKKLLKKDAEIQESARQRGYSSFDVGVNDDETVFESAWDETKYERDSDGKFAPKGGETNDPISHLEQDFKSKVTRSSGEPPSVSVNGVPVSISLHKEGGEVVLTGIDAAEKGKGSGIAVMQSLRNYADRSGDKLRVRLVANSLFFEKFPWLNRDDGGDYTYDPHSDQRSASGNVRKSNVDPDELVGKTLRFNGKEFKVERLVTGGSEPDRWFAKSADGRTVVRDGVSIRKGIDTGIRVTESSADWDESEHPRDDAGRFADKAGGSSSTPHWSDLPTLEERQTGRRAEAAEIVKQATERGMGKKRPHEMTVQVFIARETTKKIKELEKAKEFLSPVFSKYNEFANTEDDQRRYALSHELEQLESQPEYAKAIKKYSKLFNDEDSKTISIPRAMRYLEGEISSLRDNLTEGWWTDGKAGSDMAKKHRDAVSKAVREGIDVPDDVLEPYRYESWIPKSFEDRMTTRRTIQLFDQHKREPSVLQVANETRQKLTNCQRAEETVKSLHSRYEEPEFNSKQREFGRSIIAINEQIDQARAEMNRISDAHPNGIPDMSPESIQEFAKWDQSMHRLADQRHLVRSQQAEHERQVVESQLRTERGTDLRLQVDLGDDESWLKDRSGLDRARSFLESVLGPQLSSMVLRLRPIPPNAPYGPNRAYASSGTMYVPEDVSASTVVHEAGHLIDQFDNTIGIRSHAFMVDRTKGEVGQHIGWGYEPNEVASKDKFMDVYTGKYYANPYTSEVLSMGLQHLFDGWVQFMAQDRDHLHYTLSAIRGEIKQ